MSKSNSSSQSNQTIPLFRRKRSYLLIFLSLLLLIFYLRNSTSSTSGPFSKNPSRQTKPLIHAKGPLKKPTAALEALALQQGLLRPMDANGNDLPQSGRIGNANDNDSTSITNSESLFLLLQALKKKDWDLNQKQGHALVQPKNEKEMIKSLGKLGLNNRLFKSSRQEWLLEQRLSNPLTVFSKSYCPYSKKAKHLLSSMGAKFQVYEVDQRSDADLLQPLLAKLAKGHRTFPTIFVQDTLIGGYDDLENLNEDESGSGNGNLRKLLKNAGAI